MRCRLWGLVAPFSGGMAPIWHQRPAPCWVYAALSLGTWLADKEGDAPPPGVLEWGSKQEARRRYEPSAPRRGHLPLVEVRRAGCRAIAGCVFLLLGERLAVRLVAAKHDGVRARHFDYVRVRVKDEQSGVVDEARMAGADAHVNLAGVRRESCSEVEPLREVAVNRDGLAGGGVDVDLALGSLQEADAWMTRRVEEDGLSGGP